MKRKLLVSILFLIPLFSVQAQWEIVGGSDSYFIPNPGTGNGQSQSIRQMLQFHPVTNEPYVFFSQATTNVKTGPTLVKYNGTSWEYIDTQFEEFAVVGDEAWGFYFRKDSNLPVVFYQNSYYENASLKKRYRVIQRVGDIWEEIIGVDNTTVNDVYFGAGKTRMLGHPVSHLPVIPSISPQINVFGHKTLLAQFSDSKWSNLGDANFSEVGASEVDLDYNFSTAVPYVITRYQDTNTFIPYVNVFTFQGSWTKLGETGFSPVNGDGFRVRVNQLNGDVFAMVPENYNNPNNAQTKTLTVKKWNGTDWETLGTSAELFPTTLLGYDLEIHPVTGVPYVCFIDGNAPTAGTLNIRKWNGQNWVSIADATLLGTLGEKIDLVFEPQTNTPHVISSAGQLYKCLEPTTSVEDKILANITVYPNPASTEVEIKGIEVKKVSVYDIRGKEILSSTKTKFSIEKLETGLYFLVATDKENRSITKKLIIQ